ncbi:MAG: hypothetical protein AABY54_03205 [Deltaproteobacteria bacterium]
MISSNWKLFIGVILVALSAVLGVLHYAVFGDANTLLFYLALDIVFVPVQVLLVTVIIEKLLTEREQQIMLKKLNMVIGAFYSEVGNNLLLHFRKLYKDTIQIDARLKVNKEWSDKDFRAAIGFAKGCDCYSGFDSVELAALQELLISKRGFMLGLLQNPSLLEHDRFTDLLWAVFHLTEELAARQATDSLPPEDIDHLNNDMRRAFGLLISEWLEYMKHLKIEYPYLFSLAVRTNPFNPEASVVIK